MGLEMEEHGMSVVASVMTSGSFGLRWDVRMERVGRGTMTGVLWTRGVENSVIVLDLAVYALASDS